MKNLRTIALALLASLYLAIFLFAPTVVQADAESDCKAKTDGSKWNSSTQKCETPKERCINANTNNVWVEASGSGSDGKTYEKRSDAYCWYSANHGCGTDTFFDWGCDNSGGNQVQPLFISILNWLAVGVAIAVLAGVIYGAVLYTSAGGNTEQTKKSQKIIRNAFAALIMYFAMWALLNWLVPGGLFN